MAAKMFHVAFLSAKQQVVIRLVCLNLFELYTKMYIDRVAEDHSNSNVLDQFANIKAAHRRFERITKNFAYPEDLATVKGKLFQFDGVGIRNIIGALKYFDAENTARPHDEINLIGEIYEDTCKLFSESMKFEYTVDDVKKIRGGK
jgi:hypothetical protein